MYSGGIDPKPAFIILAIAGCFLVFFLTRKKPELRLGWYVLVVYSAFLLSILFFPIPISQEAISYSRWRAEHGLGAQNNFQLFSLIKQTYGTSNFIYQVGGNLALLFPLGLILGFLAAPLRIYRNVIMIASVVIAIESLQAFITFVLGFPFRSFDVDDIWLNFLGGILGLVIARAVIQFRPEFQWQLRRLQLTRLEKAPY